MIKENCNVQHPLALSNYLSCLCYDGDNVFAPWPSTTTTTPAPKPMPPVPHPYTTPAPPTPLKCNVPKTCWAALNNMTESHGTTCMDELDPKKCGSCLHRHWGKGKRLAKAGCPESQWDAVTIGLCICGPLNPSHCVTKISGVCNAYRTPVTLSNNMGLSDNMGLSRNNGRRRRAFGCTASPGGTCQVGRNGSNAGEQIPGCSGYTPTETCFDTTGPSVRSADGRTNFQFWSKPRSRSIVGMSSDSSGQPAGNRTALAHTCGYHEQWSVVVDAQGGISFYQSENGLTCPDGLFPAELLV